MSGQPALVLEEHEVGWLFLLPQSVISSLIFPLVSIPRRGHGDAVTLVPEKNKNVSFSTRRTRPFRIHMPKTELLAAKTHMEP